MALTGVKAKIAQLRHGKDTQAPAEKTAAEAASREVEILRDDFLTFIDIGKNTDIPSKERLRALAAATNLVKELKGKVDKRDVEAYRNDVWLACYQEGDATDKNITPFRRSLGLTHEDIFFMKGKEVARVEAPLSSQP